VDALAAWQALEPPWRSCLELAWEAFGAGTVPVGAVIVGENAETVARGRNRIFDSSAPEGEFYGSRLAHAEINALAQLDSGRRWDEFTLYTSLEPCPLCVGASLVSSIGRVRYLVDDPILGGVTVARIPLVKVRGELSIDGPAGGAFGVVSESLLAAFVVSTDEGPLKVTMGERLGGALRRGEALTSAGLRDQAAAGVPLVDVLPAIWDVLALG
jgi:tRNA(adenine34) deaminase